MASIPLPTRVEETSVTFVGFPSGQADLFHTFIWELVAGTEAVMMSGLRGERRDALGSDLTKLVTDALEFQAVAMRATSVYGATPFDSGDYTVVKTSDGFKVYPTSEQRRLKATRLFGRIVYKEFSFLYGGIPRKAETRKILPWGIRGLTKDGLRNFRWDKMAVIPQETPRPPMTIKIKSESAGGSGKLYLWVAEAHGDVKTFEDPSYLKEVILFKTKRIISPDTVLRRQHHETPPGA